MNFKSWNPLCFWFMCEFLMTNTELDLRCVVHLCVSKEGEGSKFEGSLSFVIYRIINYTMCNMSYKFPL
jgi:hypothetical protein